MCMIDMEKKHIMRTTAEETRRNKELIINTGIQIFLKKGYDAANMRDIAEAAGISRGPLYYHFESKSVLYLACVKAYSERSLIEYRRIFSQDKHILELLREDLYYCTRNIAPNSEHPIFTTSKEDSLKEDSIKEANQIFKTYRKRVYEMKVDSIARAIQKGELKKEADPYHMVNMMFIFYEGLYNLIEKTDFITSKMQVSQTIESLITLFKQ